VKDVDSKGDFGWQITLLLLLVLAFAAYAYHLGWLRF
jgi:hypothetical protein